LTELYCHDLKGRRIVLNIFPSLDTSVCATSVRKFNELAASLDNTTVVAVSKDLPFAQSRFCTTEGIKNLIAASAFRSPEFSKDYGVEMVDGPLAGLLARAVVVIDENGKVIHAELVPEIAQEPNYEAAIKVLK
jgi:thiol peroxidase